MKASAAFLRWIEHKLVGALLTLGSAGHPPLFLAAQYVPTDSL